MFEFKSEKDGLTVDDYNKVMGYAYFYAASNHTHVADITISFAVTIHPKNLLHYLEHDRKFTVTESDDGIYTIAGDTFPVQILESKKLSAEKNLFLKNLRSNLNVAEAKKTVDAYKAIKEFESKNAYIHRLAGANSAIFKEMMTMNDAAIKEVIIMALAEEGGFLREHDVEKLKKVATNFLRLGRPIEEVAAATELPIETVAGLI